MHEQLVWVWVLLMGWRQGGVGVFAALCGAGRRTQPGGAYSWVSTGQCHDSCPCHGSSGVWCALSDS
jgi:hypothetical protein